MKLSISIVIPTFNGIDLLQTYLPSVIKHSHGADVIVVDDASTDDSVAWLRKNYPTVQVISLKENKGFATAVNTGFKHAKTDLVLLLNNDVKLYKNTILTLAQNFLDKPDLFGVGATEKLPSGKKRGKSCGSFQRGFLIHQSASVKNSGPSLWLFAASAMFDRHKWLKLAGMDHLYRPAYWEDIDIGYRAWKAGFTCWFDHQAIVYHQAESTMNRELKWKKQIIVFKNQCLFYWKNISDLSLIWQHFIWLPYHLVVTSIRSKGAFLIGFLWALVQLAEAVSQPQNYQQKRSDRQVIEHTT